MTANFYSVLGVGRDASLSQIHRAFRAMAHQCDIDRHLFANEAERSPYADPIAPIRNAYQMLSHTTSRADYERELQHRDQASGGRGRHRHDAPAQSSRGRAPGSVLPPIDLFGSFESFGPSRAALLDRWQTNYDPRHQPKSHAARQLDVEIVLSPDQAERGGSIPLDVPVARLCQTCAGTGSTGFYDCDPCQGHGIDWQTVRIDVLLSPPVRDNTLINVPLKHLGVQNLYLRVHARVG